MKNMITVEKGRLLTGTGSGRQGNEFSRERLLGGSFYRNALERVDGLCGKYRLRLASFLEKSVLRMRHLERGAEIYERKLAECGRQREEFSISIEDIPLRRLPEAEEMLALLRQDGEQGELFKSEKRLADAKHALALSGSLFARAKDEAWLYATEEEGRYSPQGDAVRSARKLADALFHLEQMRCLIASGDTAGAQKYFDKHVLNAKTGAARMLHGESELAFAIQSDLVLHEQFRAIDSARTPSGTP
jgi:hypothetical protein